MKKIYTYISLALLSISSAFGQDSQFSIFDASPMVLNPALTGSEKETPLRVVTQYRNQWKAVSSNYVTSAVAIDVPLNKWGVGAYISNNETSQLISEFNFMLSGSYDVMKSGQDKHHLTAGANIGLISKKLDPKELIFDSQFDERVFNENIPSGETILRESRLLPEISFGVNYEFTDPKKSIHPYLGTALYHLTRPNESFIINDKIKSPFRYVINGGTYLYFNDRKFVLHPKGAFIGQGKARNILLGLTGDYEISQTVQVNTGVTYRVNESIIPQIGISYLNFTYYVCYDINISTLSEFSGNRGALEFALVYRSKSTEKSKSKGFGGKRIRYR